MTVRQVSEIREEGGENWDRTLQNTPKYHTVQSDPVSDSWDLG